jgi:hypothetical protein
MWKNFKINSNCIEARTEKAMLIKIPDSDFKFWHTSKLVRFEGKKGDIISIGFTDEFKFKLFRTGNSTHNSREKLEEITMSASELVEKYFNKEVA